MSSFASLYQVTVVRACLCLLQAAKQLRGFRLQQVAAHSLQLWMYYQAKHHHQTAKSRERGEPKASAASIPASIATLHIGLWFLRPLKLARALADPVSGQSFLEAAFDLRAGGEAMQAIHHEFFDGEGGPADENPVNTRLAQFGEIEAETLGETGDRDSGVWLGAWTRRYGRCIKELRNPAPSGPGGCCPWGLP